MQHFAKALRSFRQADPDRLGVDIDVQAVKLGQCSFASRRTPGLHGGDGEIQGAVLAVPLLQKRLDVIRLACGDMALAGLALFGVGVGQ